MNARTHWLILPASTMVVCASAYATTYLTVEQAQAAIFPGARMTSAEIALSDAARRDIERRSGVNVRRSDVRVWKVEGGGWFIVDDVVGKHEFITFALGLAPDGSVTGIEVMDYRESYGHEIRDRGWRQQFSGKTARDPLVLDRDIRNISGATLSCRHITDGVKRLLATYEVVLKP
jgi:hypothetical protein